VPQQLLQKHGSGMEEVFAGRQTPNLRAALGQLISESRQHLDTALALLANVPAGVRPIFLPLAMVRRDLAQMSRADADPFVPQVTSRFSILWTLWRASRSKAFKSQAFNAG
jgi:phytoene synthase